MAAFRKLAWDREAPWTEHQLSLGFEGAKQLIKIDNDDEGFPYNYVVDTFLGHYVNMGLVHLLFLN